MAESLETGLVLMLAGMGTVFVSKLSRWLELPAAALPAAHAATATTAVDRELLSVIGAAIKAHRDRRTQR
jgi:Na+-transporting methylmalonyl-CoA/oxaloacetate decarboxylase gamma subunit